MRKYVRKMLRCEAEQKGVKASKFVHRKFENLQIKKQGKKSRDIHRVIGTHKRRVWKSRIELFS